MRIQTDIRGEIYRGALWGILLKGWSVPIKLLTTIILTRTLSPEIFGFYNLLNNLHGVFGFVIGSGVIHSISRFIPELLEQGKGKVALKLTSYLAIFRATVAAIVCIICYLNFEVIISFLNIPSDVTPYAGFVLLILWLPRAFEVIGVQFRSAALDYKPLAIHDTIAPLVLCVLVASVRQNGVGLFEIVWALLLTEIASAIIYSYFFLVSFFRMRAPTSTEDLTHTDAVVSPHLLKRVMKYSLNTTLYGFGAIGLGTGIDGIIISRYFGVAEVGIYAFAFSLIIAIHGLNPLILLKGLFINLVTRNFVKTGCRQELANSGQLAVRAGFFVGFPLFSYVCLLGAPIINLVYSPALLPATTLLPIFSIMALVRCSTLVNFAVASTLELSRYLSLINLIGVINVVLALLLAPRFGIVGVAAATCASELVWTFYLGWVVLRIGNVPLKFIDKSFFVVCFNMLVGAVPILVERSNISSISGLLALGAVSFCLYALASYLHSPFSSAEWSAMISVVKKRK